MGAFGEGLYSLAKKYKIFSSPKVFIIIGMAYHVLHNRAYMKLSNILLCLSVTSSQYEERKTHSSLCEVGESFPVIYTEHV